MRSPAHRRPRLTLVALEARETPAAGVWSAESFDAGPAPPADWDVRPVGDLRPSVTAGELHVLPGGRAWEKSLLPADAGIRARVRLNGLGPAQLVLRGRDLSTGTPTHYAATVGRDGAVRIQKVLKGVPTPLARSAVPAWAAGTWLTATFQARGSELTLELRPPTGDSVVLRATDSAIAGAGRAGVARPVGSRGQLAFDDFTVLAADPPAEAFDASPVGGLPGGWTGWGSDAKGVPGVTAGQALAVGGTSGSSGRAWVEDVLPSDVRVRATVPVESLVPALLFARGRNLNTGRPTFYAASVVRGTEIKLVRVVDGNETVLGALKTRAYLSQVPLEVSLTAQGNRLQVRVRRPATGLWLTADGDWKASPAAALVAEDDAIPGAGQVGVGRAAAFAGAVSFDDFSAHPADGDVKPPVPTAVVTPRGIPQKPGTMAGFVRFTAQLAASETVNRVEFFVDGTMVSRRTAAPYRHDFETRNLANGRHTLLVRVWDAAGNVGESAANFTVFNRPANAPPEVPRHYDHIRYAALAYTGNPMGPAEHQQLRDSVDLVVPNDRYLPAIEAAAPETPQLVYSNISNLYLDLLTDWLTFADRAGGDREAAFYHVAGPTRFAGNSPSSQPVSWFWNVGQGPAAGAGTVRSLTNPAHDARSNDVPFGAAGQTLHIGYPDRFREVDVTIGRPAAAGWSGAFEYPSAVDDGGRPVAWKSLATVADTSDGLRRSGAWTFDPPADWTAAVVAGSTARLFYVRVRTTSGTTVHAPVASSILGRDFVQANGGTAGTIPAFDSAADWNRDGYLSDAEYATRQTGFDARFVSESRWFYPGYGQMRYATNPGGAGVADWAGDYHRRFLAARPLADGVFMDNSGGRLPTDPAETLESRETYASDYGAALGAVHRAIAPKWVLANTVAGGTEADRVARQVPATLEEFALRPMAHSWQQFRETAEQVARRLALTDPAGYLILDTLSTNGSPMDPRTRLAALAYYYLLADPEATFLMTWGGEEPASAWSRHWFDAIGYDVGRPVGTWTQFAAGPDPTAATRTYQVLSRAYDHALVLYKPLSYAAGRGNGGTGDGTATTHDLNGRYRALNADGSLGPVVVRVTLRNGEGAILVKA